jgi:serine/threonine protein kinase
MPADSSSPVAAARTGDVGDDDLEHARVLARVKQRLFGGAAEPVRVEQFEILSRLGAGAMGVVYEARDTQLDRVVALKLLHPENRQRSTEPSDGTAALLDEARNMARVRHPNVLTVHQVGTHGAQVYVAMERAKFTLRQWLEQDRPTRERVLQVLTATGRGLAAVHRQGLVHRDFKPDNVLMDDAGQPQVSDFGLALRTDAVNPSAKAGTPAYMAPEQIRGEEVDARSDQFAFAVTALEALTGRRPFSGNGIDELLESILRRIKASDLSGDLPKQLVEVLLRALEPEPSARFSSMDALLERLETVRTRRSPAGMVIGVVLGVAALSALAVAMVYFPGERPKSPMAPSVTVQPSASSAPAPVREITRLCVQSFNASSEQEAHPARHAFDGVPATAWSEDVPGDGAGQWLEAKLRPHTWVSRLEVSGGWSAKTSAGADLWAINATFRAMRVSWDGGEAIVRFDRKTDRGKKKRVEINAATSSVRLTALEVDRGNFRDLCLDEVVIFGRCGSP